MAGQEKIPQSILDAILQRTDQLYEFIIKYSSAMYVPHDYGTGQPMNMFEAHLLTYIEEHPGATVSELATLWVRTKGAISQQLKKLEEKGLVEKRKAPDNKKAVHIYATEAGAQLSNAHKLYDIADVTQTLRQLMDSCTVVEILAFYKVIGAFNQLLDEDNLQL